MYCPVLVFVVLHDIGMASIFLWSFLAPGVLGDFLDPCTFYRKMDILRIRELVLWFPCVFPRYVIARSVLFPNGVGMCRALYISSFFFTFAPLRGGAPFPEGRIIATHAVKISGF